MQTDPRMIIPGTTVQRKDGSGPEVVRAVTVVLHLADGTDETYRVGTEEVDVVPEPVEVPADLPEFPIGPVVAPTE